MNKEVIDRLIIDRAVGALDPDVETLLDDYLSQHQEIEDRFRATAEAVQLSRTLLRSEGDAPLPAFRMPDEFRSERRRIAPLQIVGIAAALLVCFFMGRHFPGNDRPVTRQSIAENTVDGQLKVNEGMWTIARTRMRPKPPIRSTSWKWTSPVRQPEPVNKGELL